MRTAANRAYVRHAFMVILPVGLAVAAFAHATTRPAMRRTFAPRDSARLVQSASFVPLRAGARSCEQYRAPEPVSTREPLGYGRGARARLNFIIDADGNVNGVMIMSLSGQLDQQSLMEAVIGWRFRPALCDGIPIDSEANLRLESRR